LSAPKSPSIKEEKKATPVMEEEKDDSEDPSKEIDEDEV